MGGVSKAEVLVAGRMLLDHVLDAATHARCVVVVGPERLARPGVATTLEHPASGGPVAGIDAGLTALDPAHDTALDPVRDAVPGAAPGTASEDRASPGPSSAQPGEPAVLVLPCDVPRAALVVPTVLQALAAHPEADAARLVDADGHGQLVAAYRRAPLRRALAELMATGGVHGVSVRRLDEHLDVVDVPDPSGAGADADTWHDVRTLDEAISGRQTMTQPAPEGAHQDPTLPGGTLHAWAATLVEDLDASADALDIDVLLDLARDVAHHVARPAVPVTSFLVGYAVAARGGDRAALDAVVARVTELAQHRDGAGEAG
nr:DUF6457 domain-containing protein [Cellulomonas sp. APG4]